MRKLVMAVLFAALGARAEESATNGLEEASAPIVWGFTILVRQSTVLVAA